MAYLHLINIIPINFHDFRLTIVRELMPEKQSGLNWPNFPLLRYIGHTEIPISWINFTLSYLWCHLDIRTRVTLYAPSQTYILIKSRRKFALVYRPEGKVDQSDLVLTYGTSVYIKDWWCRYYCHKQNILITNLNSKNKSLWPIFHIHVTHLYPKMFPSSWMLLG